MQQWSISHIFSSSIFLVSGFILHSPIYFLLIVVHSAGWVLSKMILPAKGEAVWKQSRWALCLERITGGRLCPLPCKVTLLWGEMRLLIMLDRHWVTKKGHQDIPTLLFLSSIWYVTSPYFERSYAKSAEKLHM